MPAGGSGFGPSAPVSIIKIGNTAVGLYNDSRDAQSTDSATYRGGAIIDNAQIELIFWGSLWQGANPSRDDVTKAVQQILSGSYLSQMAQYEYQSITIREAIYVTGPEPPQSYKTDESKISY
jgi:hypothetical protein